MEVETGIKKDGLDIIRATHKESGAVVVVALYGATVMSFKPSDGKERLFLSSKAVLDGSKPIRGGIPLVFPQFGPGPLPNHGFARTSVWSYSENKEEKSTSEPEAKKPKVSEACELRFTLESSKDTMAVWPHEFQLIYTVCFGSSNLETSLRVENTGTEKFSFQSLLHTYFSLDEVETSTVSGLQGVTYLDQLQDRKETIEERNPITIDKETDAIYVGNVDKSVSVVSAAQQVSVSASLVCGSEVHPCDFVLWNPWVEKSKTMGDFDDEEYHTMICVEPGCVSRFEECFPGTSWTLTQRIHFD